MPYKKYVGNRVVNVLEDFEKGLVNSIGENEVPSPKEIIKLLKIIIELLTE